MSRTELEYTCGPDKRTGVDCNSNRLINAQGLSWREDDRCTSCLQSCWYCRVVLLIVVSLNVFLVLLSRSRCPVLSSSRPLFSLIKYQPVLAFLLLLLPPSSSSLPSFFSASFSHLSLFSLLLLSSPRFFISTSANGQISRTSIRGTSNRRGRARGNHEWRHWARTLKRSRNHEVRASL